MKLYLNKEGSLTTDNILKNTNVVINEQAHKYLTVYVDFKGGVTIRSILKLVQSNKVLQEILSAYDFQSYFDALVKYPEGSVETDLKEIKMYRTGEFNHYSNGIDLPDTPHLLGKKKQEMNDEDIWVSVDFYPLEKVVDVPLVLDSVVNLQPECLLNSVLEQEYIYATVTGFSLIEILEAVFLETNPDESKNRTVFDLEGMGKVDLFSEVDSDDFEKLGWLSDGPQSGLNISSSLKDKKNMIVYLFDLLPNSIDVDTFLKKYFADLVTVKPGLEGLNAYEFRCKTYNEPEAFELARKFKIHKETGHVLRKDKFSFDKNFYQVWNSLNLPGVPEHMYGCIKQ